MNQSQIEGLLSSACTTHGAILRAQKAVKRIGVTSQVSAHMSADGVPHAVECIKAETKNALKVTGNAVYARSDDWAAHFNVIRGARAKITTSEFGLEGWFAGLWPAELLGYMLVLLRGPTISIAGRTVPHAMPTQDDKGMHLAYRVNGELPSQTKDRIELALLHDPYVIPAELHAFLLPIQAKHRHYVQFDAA
ncbi:hypothetical protein ACOTC5_29850 [Achromobacter xylosoxidans]